MDPAPKEFSNKNLRALSRCVNPGHCYEFAVHVLELDLPTVDRVRCDYANNSSAQLVQVSVKLLSKHY